MSRDTVILKYLDSGSLDLFARQLTGTIDGARSVAVFDADGQLAWSGPDDTAAEHWRPDAIGAGPLPAEDARVELDGGRSAYSFPLRQSESTDMLGYLLVQTEGDPLLSMEETRHCVRPILKCIHKLLDIRVELSAVRLQSDSERRGLELLEKLDGLQDKGDGPVALQAAVGLIAEHFGSDLAVIWTEKPVVHKAWRRGGDVDQATCDALEPIFSRLVRAARRRRRVLDTDAPAGLRKFARTRAESARILSSPILDDKDRVAGVLALLGQRKLDRQDIRLTRVVASRIAAMVARETPVALPELTRHDLLRYIDKHLSHDPQKSRALLLIDIDKLHVINEMHGHFGGDAAIQAVYEQAKLGAGDAGVVCNMLGGAIAVFLEDCDEEAAVAQAEKMRQSLKSTATCYEGRAIEIVVSIGIAMMPSVVRDAASALNTAEVAARSAKARGGDQCVVFDDLDASVLRRREDLDQVAQLQSALVDNRFELYAQPIVSLQDADSRPRYEILLRMIDEQGRVQAPDRFLSAAQRYQMMSSIDRWVLRTASEMLRNTENQLEINLASFNINVSSQSMMDDEFPAFVEACILESGVSPDTFCFEITETAVMRNLQRAQELLRRFRKFGCRLALDDFGTGQCSFAYLKDLPVQYVKIDGAFIRDILDNPLSEAIVESVCRIASVIHARTVAEFVENDLILQRLQKTGIDFAQGYRIGKPLPLAQVLAEFDTPSQVTDGFAVSAV